MVNRSGGLTFSGSRNHYYHRDEFPILDFKELSVCLQGCDFIANEELVSRPSAKYIRALFEQILDTFMGFSPEYCVTTTKTILQGDPSNLVATNEDSNTDDIAETMQTLVFFRAANSLLQTCGVHDFRLMDLVRPEPQRIRRILSAVINYARFREEHLRECEPLVRECEGNAEEVRKAEEINTALANNIDLLKGRLGVDTAEEESHRKSTLVQLNNYNLRLEQELKKLQNAQETLKHEHGAYKEAKTRLYEKLEDHHYLIGESMREVEKLKAYTAADPTLLQRIIDDLKTNLQQCEDGLREHEQVLSNKHKTVDAMETVEDELRNLIKIVQEVSNDARKLEEARDNLTRQTEELESKSRTSDELAVHIQRVARQLSKSAEKIVKLRQQARERENNAKQRLAGLESEYARLVEERDAKEEKLVGTKAEINELEAQIHAMRSEFDAEWRSTETAVAKLNAHVRMYLSDVGSQM